MTTHLCPSSSSRAIPTAAAIAEPELPPAGKPVSKEGVQNLQPERLPPGRRRELTAQKPLVSDQPARHGERFRVSRLVPHVHKLRRFAREREAVSLGKTHKCTRAWKALTDLSSTVGTKSYPMPSTSYEIFLSFSSSDPTREEPSGSTATI